MRWWHRWRLRVWEARLSHCTDRLALVARAAPFELSDVLVPVRALAAAEHAEQRVAYHRALAGVDLPRATAREG